MAGRIQGRSPRKPRGHEKDLRCRSWLTLPPGRGRASGVLESWSWAPLRPDREGKMTHVLRGRAPHQAASVTQISRAGTDKRPARGGRLTKHSGVDRGRSAVYRSSPLSTGGDGEAGPRYLSKIDGIVGSSKCNARSYSAAGTGSGGSGRRTPKTVHKSGQPHQQAVAVLLHLQRLPFDDRRHPPSEPPSSWSSLRPASVAAPEACEPPAESPGGLPRGATTC